MDILLNILLNTISSSVEKVDLHDSCIDYSESKTLMYADVADVKREIARLITNRDAIGGSFPRVRSHSALGYNNPIGAGHPV